jgi:excisionase family DNA binding protein
MRQAPTGYIRKQQAATVLGMTVRSVDNYMKTGLIDFYKFGRSVYFKESELLEAVEARKVARKAEDAYKVA